MASRPFLVKKEDTTSPTSFHRVTQDGKTMRSKDRIYWEDKDCIWSILFTVLLLLWHQRVKFFNCSLHDRFNCILFVTLFFSGVLVVAARLRKLPWRSINP